MKKNGLTYIELMVSLVLVGLLASVVFPFTSLLTKKNNEIELKRNLNEIRSAIDAYKNASDKGEIHSDYVTESGYPPKLEMLTGVPNNTNEKILRFIRKIPSDPFYDNQFDDKWTIRSYDSEFLTPKKGKDVYDIYSKSIEKGTNGIQYKYW
ncbi:type II secretion system protein [Acinetobacter guillouiae]|uniref:type II secretion system protein n=1 Tax=Acinetobacter guillouiae TaxID=106649 RepID=UPI0028ECFE43|nr:type II secretion system protein [Acinetobacter guillouiae]